MSAPKSVTKVNKDGVTYTSNVDWCNYALFELSRAALRDVAKFIKKRWVPAYYGHVKQRTGKSKKSFFFKVYSSANTKFPRVEVGIKHAAPGKPVQGFYAFFHEYGTKYREGGKMLKGVVENNIAQIVEIESQYLSALQDEAAVLRMIDEKEMEGDGDE